MRCLEARLKHRLALATLLAWSAAAPAQDSGESSDQPNGNRQSIEWSADGNSSMTTENGVRSLRMSDNVTIIQGGLEIRGDTAVIEYRTETNELSRVTVLGAPARYRQALDDADSDAGDPVTGSGDTILFYSDAEGNSIIELIGNAAIRSNDMETNCETIVYVAELELIRASGNCAGAFAPRDD